MSHQLLYCDQIVSCLQQVASKCAAEVMPGDGLIQSGLVSPFLQHLCHRLGGDTSAHLDLATLPNRAEYWTRRVTSKEKPIVEGGICIVPCS
jgi:hypothetical protein